MDTKRKLSLLTISLHWLIGLTIIALGLVGFYMTHWSQWHLFQTHKVIGICVLFLSLARIAWRIKNGWPPHIAQHSPTEMFLARYVHWVLILSTVAMPLFGILHSGASGNGLVIAGITFITPNPSPINPANPLAYSEFWSNVGQTGHLYTAYLIIAALGLHISGALKHHFIDKDHTLKRMLGITNNKD